MMTANGESSSMKQGKVFVPRLGKTVDPYLAKSTPAVLSVGMRCIDDGYDFIWKGSKGEEPYFVKPDGKVVPLTVNDYVPYLAAKPRHLAAAPAKKVARREAVPVADVEPERDTGEDIIHIVRDDPPLDIDGFVAEMEELASVDPPKGLQSVSQSALAPAQALHLDRRGHGRPHHRHLDRRMQCP